MTAPHLPAAGRAADAPVPAVSGPAQSAARPTWLPWRVFPFHSRWVDVNGTPVHHVDEGSGPVLLMLPPGPAWSFLYRDLILGLRDFFRCIALDYPGFGLSPPAGDGTLRGVAEVVEGFVLTLGLSGVTLLVHDAGGPIGLRAAARHPERFRALVLSDTFAWPLAGYPAVRRSLLAVTGRLLGPLTLRFNLLPRLVAGAAPRRRRLPGEERRALTGAFAERASRERMLHLMRQLATDHEYLGEVERTLGALRALPTLVIFGGLDPVRLFGFDHRLAETFPRSRRVLIRGEGHFPHLGAPQDVIAAIRAWAAAEHIVEPTR